MLSSTNQDVDCLSKMREIYDVTAADSSARPRADSKYLLGSSMRTTGRMTVEHVAGLWGLNPLLSCLNYNNPSSSSTGIVHKVVVAVVAVPFLSLFLAMLLVKADGAIAGERNTVVDVPMSMVTCSVEMSFRKA